MLPEADRIRLKHMLDAALEAMEFAQDCTRESLETIKMLSRAIVRDVEVVGEAASRVSPETQPQCPGIPWAAVVGMRNRLVHGYFDIDLDRVWDTVTIDLPTLVEELRRILEP